MTCPGSLIVHADGTVASCSLDDEDGCRGRELRHEGDPTLCLGLAARTLQLLRAAPVTRVLRASPDRLA
jgi:hypothetical protein